MKIRLGITAPLAIESSNSTAYRLPEIVERNFKLGSELKHSCWLESETPIQSKLTALTSDRSKARHAVRGEVPDSAMHTESAVIRFARVPDTLVLARDKKDDARVIKQLIQTVTNNQPTRIAVVLDGSQGMTPAYAKVARALDGFPRTSELGVWLAQDGVRQIYSSSWSQHETASRSVQAQRGIGGQDNIPALLQAWEWAQANPNSVVLWVHNSQPVILGSIDFLQQRLDWKSGDDAPRIIDVPVRNGPNRVLEQLAASTAVTALPRFGSLDQDLERLVGVWAGRRVEQVFVRTVEKQQTAPSPRESSSHVVRLWAFDMVRQLMAGRSRDAAVALAAEQQLVTPVSGAVALETAEQYRMTGLSPSDPATVPVVPEPGPLLLLALGVMALLISRRMWTRENASEK